MGAAKPSKKQRGKLKATAKSKKAEAPPSAGAGTGGAATASAAPKTHIKFDDNGEKVTAASKKRARAAAAASSKKKKKGEEEKPAEGGGQADRSPEMIQQAKFYLEQWKRREEPVADGELPWKFKVRALHSSLSVGGTSR